MYIRVKTRTQTRILSMPSNIISIVPNILYSSAAGVVPFGLSTKHWGLYIISIWRRVIIMIYQRQGESQSSMGSTGRLTWLWTLQASPYVLPWGFMVSFPHLLLLNCGEQLWHSQWLYLPHVLSITRHWRMQQRAQLSDHSKTHVQGWIDKLSDSECLLLLPRTSV